MYILALSIYNIIHDCSRSVEKSFLKYELAIKVECVALNIWPLLGWKGMFSLHTRKGALTLNHQHKSNPQLALQKTTLELRTRRLKCGSHNQCISTSSVLSSHASANWPAECPHLSKNWNAVTEHFFGEMAVHYNPNFPLCHFNFALFSLDVELDGGATKVVCWSLYSVATNRDLVAEPQVAPLHNYSQFIAMTVEFHWSNGWFKHSEHHWWLLGRRRSIFWTLLQEASKDLLAIFCHWMLEVSDFQVHMQKHHSSLHTIN